MSTTRKKHYEEYEGKLEDAGKDAAKLAGEYLKDRMRDTIFFQLEPWAPLKQSTLDAKAPESRTLIDEQQLVMSITTKAKDNTATVGIHRDAKGNAVSIGAVHEFGYPAGGIPERSFIRSTWGREKNKVEDIIETTFKRALS